MPQKLRCRACGVLLPAFPRERERCAECGGPLERVRDPRRVLKPNLPVRLLTETGTSGPGHPVRVESVSRDRLTLSLPVGEGDPVVEMGTGVRVEFVRRDPAVQGRYRFRAEVVETREDPLPVLIAASPGYVRHIQERGSFRLPVRIPVLYHRLGSRPADPQRGRTVNLSSAGLLLAVENTVPEYTFLRLEFSLEGLRFTPRGRVVHSDTSLVDGRKWQGMGIEFMGLGPEDREQITAWIFRQQREMLNKGLLSSSGDGRPDPTL